MNKKRLVVEMPEELHKILKLRAAYNGIPMSLWVINAIREKIGDAEWNGFKSNKSSKRNDPDPS